MTQHSRPVYALDMFHLADNDEYRQYARRSGAGVGAHGVGMVSLGRSVMTSETTRILFT